MKDRCAKCKKEFEIETMQIVDGGADLPTGEILTFFGPLCPSCFGRFQLHFVRKEGRVGQWWQEWETAE